MQKKYWRRGICMNDGAIYTEYELDWNVGLFNIKDNLQSRFWLMLNIPILSESFCSVFHAMVCKLLTVF